MSTKPKYEGVAVWMDGQEWIVPPLSVSQFRKHGTALMDTTVEGFEATLEIRLPIMLCALQRNYPDLTEEVLLDMLDVRTMPVVFRAMLNLSGFRDAQPGESQPEAAT